MLIVGHRGARREAPENTLAGFRHLRDLGLRAVEFDIQVSRDGELVVIHDPVLERTTNGRGQVGEHAAADLARLDACRVPFPAWPDREGVPTLDQVLTLLADFTHLELEVKARTQADEAAVIARLPALWARHRLDGRARTTSFNPRYLHGIREAAPEIARGFLCEADFSGDAVQVADALGCASLGPNESLCTRALIEAAHAAGLYVSTWTVNSQARAQMLRTLGVDALITDVPTQALAWGL